MLATRILGERSQRLEMKTSQYWERLYTNAILEPTRSKVTARIEAAQAAIESRLREMKAEADHDGTAEERLDIEAARASLEIMRRRMAMQSRMAF